MFLVKTHFFQWISHVWFFFFQFVLISTPSLFSKNLNPFRGWKNKTSSTSANRSDTEMTLTKGYQCLWSCQTLESSFAAAGGVASIQSCRCHLCDLVGPTLVTLGKVSSAQYFGCNLRWILLSVLVPGMDPMLIRPWFYFHVFVAFQGCQLGSGFGTAGLACTDLSRAEEILFPQAMHVTSSCHLCMLLCMNWHLATQWVYQLDQCGSVLNSNFRLMWLASVPWSLPVQTVPSGSTLCLPCRCMQWMYQDCSYETSSTQWPFILTLFSMSVVFCSIYNWLGMNFLYLDLLIVRFSGINFRF